MAKKYRRSRVVLVAGLTILLSWGGELMPQGLKDAVESGVNTSGLPFMGVWILAMVLLAGLVLWLTAKNEEPPPEGPPQRVVQQTGEKATYVEKNTGGIHIS